MADEGQTEPSAEGVGTTAPEADVRLDPVAEVLSAGQTTPPRAPKRSGPPVSPDSPSRKRALEERWSEVVEFPVDNLLKRKAEGDLAVESRVVGGLFALTEDCQGQDIDESMDDDSSEASDEWWEDEEVDMEDVLIAEARQVELDNWERFKVYKVKTSQEAAAEGYTFLKTRWVNAKRDKG
jgi:hypothetical protein